MLWAWAKSSALCLRTSLLSARSILLPKREWAKQISQLMSHTLGNVILSATLTEQRVTKQMGVEVYVCACMWGMNFNKGSEWECFIPENLSFFWLTFYRNHQTRQGICLVLLEIPLFHTLWAIYFWPCINSLLLIGYFVPALASSSVSHFL